MGRIEFIRQMISGGFGIRLNPISSILQGSQPITWTELRSELEKIVSSDNMQDVSATNLFDLLIKTENGNYDGFSVSGTSSEATASKDMAFEANGFKYKVSARKSSANASDNRITINAGSAGWDYKIFDFKADGEPDYLGANKAGRRFDDVSDNMKEPELQLFKKLYYHDLGIALGYLKTLAKKAA
ncbi:hypothetical protein HYS31_07975 [Candidatus Woesearchaeota archaeon]|nr:hypothetical protein [Candidatus Woesearchaeota archaeon]